MAYSKSKRDLYQEVTDKIIDSLEQGVSPWVCPWDRSGEMTLPVNHSSGDFYRGINVCLLWMEQQLRGFSSSRWMTYKQAAVKGGYVKKGEKGTTVIFYKTGEKETGEFNENGEGIIEKIPMLRSFTVFNLDQIEGIELPEPKTNFEGGFDSIEAAETVLMASGVVIHESGTRAFYRPSTDEITMPDRTRFISANDYYATALHELVHATKHKSRCDRVPYDSKQAKGAYAFEELVAELGANFCMAGLGLSGSVQAHASYIDHWLGVLREDKKAIFKAAAQAQKAHEWIEQATQSFLSQNAA